MVREPPPPNRHGSRAQARKLEALGRLSGGLAHDINNLLTIIIGDLELLTEGGAVGASSAELAGEALDAALRGADLTRRLLAFSRRESLSPQESDLNIVIRGLADMLARALGESIILELTLASDLRRAIVDRAELEAAIINIASNARDAMPGGGRVRIVTRNEFALNGDVRALLAISDTGTGMLPQVIEQAFDPFFTTKPATRGHGLGLAMVREFVRRSGGSVEILSEPDKGTTVRLSFPAAPGAPAPADREAASFVTEGASTHVLVVEDNTRLRRIVVRRLEKAAFVCLEAEDADAAMHLLESRSDIDLLFTDVVLPGGTDGRTLALLARQRQPSLAIILTSAQTSLVAIPGIPVLAKPYRGHDLLRVLHRALAEPRQAGAISKKGGRV